MAPEPISRFWTRETWRFLWPCLGVALLIRLFFFNGPSLHDDVSYWLQAIATGLDHAWPPLETHRHTRIGLILPVALLLKLFGLNVWAPYAFTMLGGLIEIALTFHLARQFVSERVARLATWLGVFFPLNILYSSYFYPDLWVGLLAAFSLMYWHRGLLLDQARGFALASLCFGLGWLFRETVVMCAPIYLALWLQAGRWRRPQLLWVLPPALLVLAGEMLLYQLTAGNWHYRWDAILSSKEQLHEDYAGAGSFLFSPLTSLFTTHGFGLYLVVALAVGVLRYGRLPAPLALWLLVGFAWFSWGTIDPSAWVTLLREPRYLSVLTIPCVTVLAAWLVSLRWPWWRAAVVAALVASGILGAALDLGRAKLSAHGRFAASEYNRPDAALEPYVYFGARATQNFASRRARFACATDLGRNEAAKLMPHLPGTRMTPVGEARYLVTTLNIKPEKWKTKAQEGWRVAAEISGDEIILRELAKRLLAKIRGRSGSVSSTPSLIVLENPARQESEPSKAGSGAEAAATAPNTNK